MTITPERIAPADGYVGRFAPTPSGPLHAGSLLAAVISWLDARSADGRWHLRIDDIDAPRVRPGAADAILHTLEVFGLGWDGPVTWQSRHGPAYQHALDTLLDTDRAFPCGCTRKDLAAHGRTGWEGPVYPGTCRHGLPPGREPRALRARATTRYWTIEDRFLGAVAFDLEALGSDFVIRRADGLVAYQLATVVDDMALGVNQVVRGIDLLGSTPRQMQLYQGLGATPPAYAHHPVLVALGGDKLAKATGAAAINPDIARRELARTLARAGLPPSDPQTPDTPATQLNEALEHLRRRDLADCLPVESALPGDLHAV
ncbi:MULTISPECIES: tRNA glutamyl-Q(34) synthetase GluQRS [unclassified Thioalkalivibrio]|uniref:tRNA glutamyl-Q(34) synthetase GluQRS n=1 Tax=unclassified Thioalkalivibrio TaxID=2621013 RepID=UPI00036ECB46|nr:MULTISPECIES: tRNA glutamyl-Q(34) synthetase GluQRS [unclassified Thioalkalivibrio]